MKKRYVSPRCSVTHYELKAFILAGSTPQNIPTTRSDVEENEMEDTTWGNLWQ